MKLTLLGTGTPAPDLARAGSSYLLSLSNETILIDCGPGSFRRLVEKGIALTDIDSVCLTHLHYDHCVDYACTVLTRWDQGAGRVPELDVFGPPGTSQMNARLVGESGAFAPDLTARTLHPLSQYVYEERGGVLPRARPEPRVHEVVDGSVVDRNGWRLAAAEVIHVQPHLTCLAYRIEADGVSVVFSGDTAPIEKLTRLAQNADVLVHMCHFLNGPDKDPRLTSTCSGHLDAARTAQSAGVKTLVLVHLTSQFAHEEAIHRVVEETKDIFHGTVVIGKDLEEIEVSV